MKKYFLLENKNQIGPFTIDELKEKKINETTFVWYDGLTEWTSAGSILELKVLFSVPIPTPPPPPINIQSTSTVIEKESNHVNQTTNNFNKNTVQSNSNTLNQKTKNSKSNNKTIIIVGVIIAFIFITLFVTNQSSQSSDTSMYPDLSVYVSEIKDKTFGGTKISGIVANNSTETPNPSYTNIVLWFECYKQGEFVGSYEVNVNGVICKNQTATFEFTIKENIEVANGKVLSATKSSCY